MTDALLDLSSLPAPERRRVLAAQGQARIDAWFTSAEAKAEAQKEVRKQAAVDKRKAKLLHRSRLLGGWKARKTDLESGG